MYLVSESWIPMTPDNPEKWVDNPEKYFSRLKILVTTNGNMRPYRALIWLLLATFTM